jgi:branched-chain amino acid transport system ATP-binding protein
MVAAVFGNDPRLKDPVKHSREQLSFVEFELPEDTPSEKLNTVQLKRLDLARALASKPKVMLLDELASGLTERELEPVMNIILKVRDKGITILMVEHIMDVIMGLCQQLAVINFGNKIAEGPTKEVSRDPKVVEAYLGVEED